MTTALCLLPAPQKLTLKEGVYPLTDRCLLMLDVPNPPAWRFAAARWLSRLRERLGLQWEMAAGGVAPRDLVALTVRQAPHALRAEAYTLAITPSGVMLTAADTAGAFYGFCTLIQIMEQAGGHLPCLEVSDWPDFPARGVLLDISRDKVPTLETVCALVDKLASWKVNQFQLYTEHTFAYHRHPEVWAVASPFTGQEILALDAFCRERHVELVPNQNSFGHMARWLKHPRYRALAEAPQGFVTPWGERVAGPFSLCPLDPGSLELVAGLYDELLPHFSSRLFNAGCDETFDLGQGRSQAACADQGRGRVYLEFLLKIYREVSARGHRMQCWGDIIVQHPELIAELPHDLIALEWGYEADHPFAARGAQFAAAGLPFYVCPGTSSWRSLAGRTDNALGNLRSAAEAGLEHGALGYLNTDWGDDGHWQVLPVSYLGFAAGAAYAWALEANRHLDLARAVSLYAFQDATGRAGQAAYALGNVYQAMGVKVPNASPLFEVLQHSPEQVRQYGVALTPEALRQTADAIDAALAPLAGAEMQCADADLVHQEFELTAHLLHHAVQRAQFIFAPGTVNPAALDEALQGLIATYKALWLARHRPGGLADSVGRFEQARQAYRVTG